MQKRAVKTKNKILSTAQDLFAKHGPNGVTVDKIAERADVNKQRIYAYFGNKTQLFEATLIDAFEKLNSKDNVLLELTEKDLPQFSRKILEHYIDMHENNPVFWRLIAYANLENAPIGKRLKNIKADSFAHLRKLYQAGQAKGFFHPDVDFEIYIFNIIAITYIYFSNQKTLAVSLDAALFTPTGKKQLIEQCIIMLSK